MRIWAFITLLFISCVWAQEDEKPYDFERDHVFNYASPLTPVNPEGFDRQDCLFANRLIRTMINRYRALSFQMERRCREASGKKDQCLKHVNESDSILEKLNRQFVLVKAKCTHD